MRTRFWYEGQDHQTARDKLIVSRDGLLEINAGGWWLSTSEGVADLACCQCYGGRGVGKVVSGSFSLTRRRRQISVVSLIPPHSSYLNPGSGMDGVKKPTQRRCLNA